MPNWLRNTVILTVLTIWSAAVIVSLVRGQLPDAAILGIPAFVVLAFRPGNNSSSEPQPSTPATAEETPR